MGTSDLATEFVTNLKTNLDYFRTSDKEKAWDGDFTFIQGADCQFGLSERYILKLKDPKWDREIALSTEAINIINNLDPKPRFFIVCGDMLDAFPYEGEEYELRKQQYADFLKVFKQLASDIPLVCVCGNHDVGDIPTKETIEIYRQQFGEDYFSFWVGGVKCLVLQSQHLKSPEAVPEEFERQNQLIETFADPSATHLVVFQHIPFFLKTPDEDDDVYFNIPKTLRLQLLEKLYSFGCRYIFTGHYHRNAGGFYKDLEQVVTSAIGAPLGNDPSGFRIVRVQKDKISHEYVRIFPNEIHVAPVLTAMKSNNSDSNTPDESNNDNNNE